MPMPRRAANLFLLASVAVLVATGLGAWLFSERDAAPLYALHRVAGVALALSLGWKYAIARGSLLRRLRPERIDMTLLVSAIAGLALAITLGIGLAWSGGLVSFDRPVPYSLMNIHVFAGLALLPLVALHALQRWERRPSVARAFGRRAALRLFALGAAATVVAAALDIVAPVRRLTGSRHAGSFTGNAFPLTIWSFDTVPDIAANDWRLAVSGAVGAPRTLDLAALGEFARREVDAVIDCTGGWWSEQRWSGVRLADVVAASRPTASASRVRVVSITGHDWSFEMDETADALLATHVGGEELSGGHGFPLRLVVPGRRGFQWIKWVARIEVS